MLLSMSGPLNVQAPDRVAKLAMGDTHGPKSGWGEGLASLSVVIHSQAHVYLSFEPDDLR